MKFGVVIFPGSNCDRDTVYVLRNVLEQEVVELWHKDTDIQNVDVMVFRMVIIFVLELWLVSRRL